MSAAPSSGHPLGDTAANMQVAATPSGVLSTGDRGTTLQLPRSGRTSSDWQEDTERRPVDTSGTSAAPAPTPPHPEAIEHSKQLPPVDVRLQPGNVFDPSFLDVPAIEADWYRIPSWLAGLWEEKSETILKQTDFRSGMVNSRPALHKRRQSMSFGTHPDRAGNIWHLVKLPIVRKFRLENRVEYKVQVALAFPSVPLEQVLTKARTIVVQVENDTHLIVETRQEEGLWHLSPISDRDVRCLGSMKSFDMNGIPTGISRVALKLHRLKPLETGTVANLQELRASLASYLSSHGLGGLAPDLE